MINTKSSTKENNGDCFGLSFGLEFKVEGGEETQARVLLINQIKLLSNEWNFASSRDYVN